MSTAEVLREAKRLIEAGTWVQGDELATGGQAHNCYCAATAISAAYDKHHTNARLSGVFEVIGLFKKVVGFDPNTGLGTWNDTPGRTKAEVLLAFDNAIALTEE